MAKEVLFRAVIEVLGKPREHVEKALQGYVESLKKDSRYEILGQDFAEIKKQEPDLWATFAELEVSAAKIEDLTFFCFEYMPSIIEIIEPREFTLSEARFSLFLNDLQGKLHQVDMIAKQVKLENDHLKKNMGALLKNYITLLLKQRRLTSEQLSRLTGVEQDKLEDYLDNLIDEGRINLKEGVYYLQKENGNGSKEG